MSGRILFKNLIYSSPNWTIKLLHGNATFAIKNLWKRSSNGLLNLASLADVKLLFDADGVECFVHNRCDTYRWYEAYVVERKPYFGEPFMASSVTPAWFLPMSFTFRKFFVQVGNSSLPCSLNIAAKSVNGFYCCPKSTSTEDLYRQIIDFKLHSFESWFNYKELDKFHLGLSNNIMKSWNIVRSIMKGDKKDGDSLQFISSDVAKISYSYDVPGKYSKSTSSYPEYNIDLTLEKSKIEYSPESDLYRFFSAN